jgi:hypothetical protein
MNHCFDEWCAPWQFHQPLFYSFDLMKIVLDYVDTFTANHLYRVFLILKSIPEAYWINRYQSYRQRYESTTGMPYRYDVTCRTHIQMFAQSYSSNRHLTIDRRADRSNPRLFETVIPGFHVEGPNAFGASLPNQLTNYQEMLIHEFYEPQEREIYRFFPSIKGPLGEHDSLIQITYLDNCELLQSRVFAEQLGQMVPQYNINNQLTKIRVLRQGDQIAFDIALGTNVIVRANYYQMRKFIHFVLPLIDEIHGLPGGYGNLKTILSLPVLADKRGFRLFKFGGLPKGLVTEYVRYLRGL